MHTFSLRTLRFVAPAAPADGAFGFDDEEDEGPSRLGGYSLDSDDEDEEVTKAAKTRLEVKDEMVGP